MENLKFRDEYIYLNEDIIGAYSQKDEKSSFNPTKKKLFWAVIFEHDYQSDDFVWWSENIQSLKARVAKYLENKEKGIKDLPQISDQVNRIIDGLREYAFEKFKNSNGGYWSSESSDYIRNQLLRLDFSRKMRERGFAFYNKQLVPMGIYKYL